MDWHDRSGTSSPHAAPANASRRASRVLSSARFLLLAWLLVWPRIAAAEHASVRLAYDGVEGACSDPSELRAEVAGRLGYDPFVESAGVDTISVQIRRAGIGLEGTFERRNAAHHPLGRRAISSRRGDCSELTSALAVGIAIAIDPLSLTRENPAEAPPLPAPAAPAEAPSPFRESGAVETVPLVPTRRTTPLRFVVGIGPSLALETLPGPSFGVRALAGVSYGSFELDLEGAFDAPASTAAGAGSIEASLVVGKVAPCFRYGWLLGCASLSMGTLHGTGVGISKSSVQDETFYAAAGVRAGAEWPITRTLGVRLFVEGEVPLRPTDLKTNDTTAWSTPPVGVSVVSMLVGHFF